jgi:hypothetical protein
MDINRFKQISTSMAHLALSIIAFQSFSLLRIPIAAAKVWIVSAHTAFVIRSAGFQQSFRCCPSGTFSRAISTSTVFVFDLRFCGRKFLTANQTISLDEEVWIFLIWSWLLAIKSPVASSRTKRRIVIGPIFKLFAAVFANKRLPFGWIGYIYTYSSTFWRAKPIMPIVQSFKGLIACFTDKGCEEMLSMIRHGFLQFVPAPDLKWAHHLENGACQRFMRPL